MGQSEKRKRRFAWYLSRQVAPRKAARLAGYGQRGQQQAVELAEDPVVREELSRLQRQREDARELVKAGLERILFSDAESLVDFLERREGLEEADLFGVTRIKKQNGGGWEIDFSDKLRALEMLAGLELAQQEKSPSLSPLAQALLRGGRAQEEGEDCGEEV